MFQQEQVTYRQGQRIKYNGQRRLAEPFEVQRKIATALNRPMRIQMDNGIRVVITPDKTVQA